MKTFKAHYNSFNPANREEVTLFVELPMFLQTSYNELVQSNGDYPNNEQLNAWLARSETQKIVEQVDLKNKIQHIEVKPYKLDVQKLRLPAKCKVKCSNCGTIHEISFIEHPLYYPDINKIMKIEHGCYNCGESFDFDLQLNVSMNIIQY